MITKHSSIEMENFHSKKLIVVANSNSGPDVNNPSSSASCSSTSGYVSTASHGQNPIVSGTKFTIASENPLLLSNSSTTDNTVGKFMHKFVLYTYY